VAPISKIIVNTKDVKNSSIRIINATPDDIKINLDEKKSRF